MFIYKEIIIEITREVMSEIWNDLSSGNKRSINQLRQNRDQTLIINHKGKKYWIKYDETLHSFIKDQEKINHQTGILGRVAPIVIDKVNKFNHEEYKLHKGIDKKRK